MTISIKNKILLFVFLFLVYFLITGGNFWEYDSFSVYKLSTSIIDKQSFAVDCFWGVPGKNHQCYSKYGLLMSVIIIPFYLIEKLILQYFHIGFFPPGFFPSLTNCAVTAFIGVVFYQFLRQTKFSHLDSLIGVMILSFCTMLFPYTKTLFAEPLLTLLIYFSFYLIWSKNNRILLGGAIFALAFLTKFSAVIFLPAFLYYLAATYKSFKILIRFLFPLLPGFIIFFIYNLIRFNNGLNTGYTGVDISKPINKGLYLFILSPGKSVFLYQPLIIFALFGTYFLFKKDSHLTVFFLINVFIHLLFYSAYNYQTGEWAWGPRFLYPLLPFLVLAAMLFLKKIKIVGKIVFYFFVSVSLFIELSAVYLSYHRYYSFMNVKYGYDFGRLIYYQPSFSPIIGQWKMIFHLDYHKSDAKFWREAFQEYPNFDYNYKIASPDLFFFRSRKLIVVGLIMGVIGIITVSRLSKDKSA